MYGMLQPVFCNALYSVLRRFVQWRFARPRYICKVLMKNRENMEEKFDFADFYESHYRSALRYASMYVFNDEDARDIVSDVLLRFLEQGEKLNRERNVVGLFFSMIYNKCMDYLRRRSRFKQIIYKLKQTADRFSDDEFEALCHKELFRIIGETLSGMPALQQEVFLEKFGEIPKKTLNFSLSPLDIKRGFCYSIRAPVRRSRAYYAVKREIASFDGGNFRGVCP